ncbi:hypothetical protein GN958_ATG02703 [Phytophthora infestans]|uniref:Uncharacterized protein n=1 Tax=Phytophthora infestans TaxID=4787 RepID=A0A8S9V3S9_PHYIN|nr:hypothetical protein GN958_ATG02703 [Phytophthora infestans]
MFQFMSTPPSLSSGPNFSRELLEVERFRARHRRLCRGQQAALPVSRIEALDVEEDRTRKIPANWRQKQQQAQTLNHFDDGYWPESAGTEMHLGYNAFDSTASPEGFCDDTEESMAFKYPVIEPSQQADEGIQREQAGEIKLASADDDDQQKRKHFMADVGRKVASMGFSSATTWQQRPPARLSSGEIIPQISTFGQSVTWGAPGYYITYNGQRRAMYCQPLYFT